LLPLVESFFLFYTGFSEEAGQEAHQAAPARMATTPTSAWTPKSKVEQFLDKNRKMLNDMIRKNPSLLNDSFALMMKNPRHVDFENKRGWFRSRLRKDQQRIQAHQRAIRVNVRRDQIFVDSFYQISRRSGEDLKHRLDVKFSGEEGIDMGGVSRDWFLELSKQLFNPNYALFIQSADKSTF
jgi:E3 ubiquitin-protein ligase HUWE1